MSSIFLVVENTKDASNDEDSDFTFKEDRPHHVSQRHEESNDLGDGPAPPMI